MAKESSESHSALIGLTLVAALLAPFLPLICARLESLAFRTNHTENFFRWVGLHDDLSALYQWVFKLFGF